MNFLTDTITIHLWVWWLIMFAIGAFIAENVFAYVHAWRDRPRNRKER